MDQFPGQIGPEEGKLSLQQLDLLIRRLDSLPTLPATAARLIELAVGAGQDDRSAEVGQLVCLVGSDQALTARVLHLANRAGPQVASASDAVAKIGLDAVRSVALSLKVLEAGRQTGPDGGLDLPAFFRHCLAVAAGAEMLAERLSGPVEPGQAFTCGLLHDLGKFALWQILPKTYRRVLEAVIRNIGNIADYERKIIGVDHSVVGRRLAEHWRLGEAVQKVVWMHHQPIEAIPESLPGRDLIAIVSLADAIARQRRLGFSGNYTFIRPCVELARQMSLSERELEEIASGLAERVDRRGSLLGVSDVGGQVLYRDALTGAGAELARQNQELRRRVGQLDHQVRAFAHFRDFASSLSGSPTVSDALLGIARVMAVASAVEAGSAGPVVAYAIDGETSEVTVLRYDGASEPKWRTLAAEVGGKLRQAASLTTLADEMAEYLLNDPEEATERIDPASYRHQALSCEEYLVGGVLHPSGGAGQRRAGPQEAIEALAGAIGMALGIVQGRCKAVVLSEQLARASQVLGQTQEALADAKAQAAVGEMAAGAAHEVNTPLAVVSGRAQFMRQKATTQQDRETWQLIADQAQRISDTIMDLMEFASPPAPQMEACDVGQLLLEAKNTFLGSDHPQAKSSRVDIETGQGLPPAWVDRSQIRAAIVELVSNAATASDPGKPVGLAAAMDEVNNVLLITVSDSGKGMDQRVLDHAFTPFFSLQKAGRRRGMGLPRVKRYVESNGGRIWISSRPSEGTTVYVQLPTEAGGR